MKVTCQGSPATDMIRSSNQRTENLPFSWWCPHHHKRPTGYQSRHRGPSFPQGPSLLSSHCSGWSGRSENKKVKASFCLLSEAISSWHDETLTLPCVRFVRRFSVWWPSSSLPSALAPLYMDTSSPSAWTRLRMSCSTALWTITLAVYYNEFFLYLDKSFQHIYINTCMLFSNENAGQKILSKSY